MNENTIQGDVKTGLGKAEGAAGDVLGDREMQAKGDARQVEGRAQDAIGSAQQAIGQVADQARDAASRVADQAQDAYGRVTDQVQTVKNTVDPFVREQPYAALAIAAVAGLLTGLLFAGRGSKVVYVRPRG